MNLPPQIKYFLVLIITLSFGSCQYSKSEPEGIIISGVVEYTGADSGFLFWDHPVNTQSTKINQDGTFAFHSKFPTSGFVTLRFGFNTFPIYVEGGDSISLTIDDPSLVRPNLEFKGDKARQNQFVYAVQYFTDSLKNSYARKENSQYLNFIYSLEYPEFERVTTDIRIQTVNYINKNSNWVNDADYMELQTNITRWNYIYDHLRYPLIHNSKNRYNPYFQPVTKEIIKDKIEQIDFSDLDLLRHPNYREFIRYALAIRSFESISDWIEKPDKFKLNFEAAQKIENQKIMELALYSTLLDFMDQNNYGNITTEIDDFNRLNTNKIYDITIEKLVRSFQSSEPDGIIPVFGLINQDGHTIDLRAFSENILYIDFWATWCKPCIAEHPYFVQLEMDYKDQPIKFLSISLDSENEVWQRYIKENHWDGHQLKAEEGMQSEIARFFKVNTIPRYVLIDRNSTVIDAHATRPSFPGIRQTLNELIEKKQ